MIKRIRLASRRADLTPADFAVTWRTAVAALGGAPPDVRPRRVEVGTALLDVIAEPVHDGVAFEWFHDDDHLRRYEEWLAGDGGVTARERLAEAIDAARSAVVIVDEHVMRGADWLDEHRSGDTGSVLHVALARRAEGLSLEEFLERWAAKAGRVRRDGDDEATVIPDRVRGRAYVQNRPLPRSDGDWAYDAINEVHFDALDDLVARVEWFRDVGDRPDPDLFAATWFLAATVERNPYKY